MRFLRAVCGLSFFVAACGGTGEQSQSSGEDLRTLDVAESPPAAPAKGSVEPSGPTGAPLPVSTPRIAYAYGYTFRLPARKVVAVQEEHLEFCRSLGPTRCRPVNLERSASSGDYVTATTILQVAAPIAPAFGARLVASATDEGAETIDRTISGEDLSRQMVDSEARIRTREALIRRLTSLLETRSGNIQQAVEAERAITAAQEELEAARGWLAEMRTRVDMSTFTLRYESGAPLAGGLSEPVREALGEVGGVFARSLATLILILGVLLPWVLIGLLAWFLVRRLRRRARGPADDGAAASLSETRRAEDERS